MIYKLYHNSIVDLKKKRKRRKNQTRNKWCRKYISQEPPRPETGNLCCKRQTPSAMTTKAAASSCANTSCSQVRLAEIQSLLKPGPQASSPMEEGHFSNSFIWRPAFSLTPPLLWGWGGSQDDQVSQTLDALPRRPTPRSLHLTPLLLQHGPATPGGRWRWACVVEPLFQRTIKALPDASWLACVLQRRSPSLLRIPGNKG